jgi:hypothetical protein
VKTGTGPENYLSALYGLIKQKVKRKKLARRKSST